LKNIDKLHSDQVFNDEVKKVQEEYLKKLLDVRSKTAKAIKAACEIAASGSGGAGGDMVPKK
jgi:hypothetical protein